MADETKDPQRSFEAPLNKRGRLRIRLSKRPRAGAEVLPAHANEPEGFIAPIDDPDELIRRRVTSITFHDLGTRLRSVPTMDEVGPTTYLGLERRQRGQEETAGPYRHDEYFNEYVEIATDIPARFWDTGDPIDEVCRFCDYIDGSEYAEWDRECLGQLAGSGDEMNPLGHTEANVTGRKLANCLQLPFNSQWLYVDVTLGGLRYPLGPVGQRPYVNNLLGPAVDEAHHKRWRNRKPNPAKDSTERWNPYTGIATGLAWDQGRLFPKGGSLGLKVEGRLFYESFDVEDTTRFKLTKLPAFTADEVAWPKIHQGQQVRVFLKPRLHFFVARYQNYVMSHERPDYGRRVPQLFWFVGRFPVYPYIPKAQIGAIFTSTSGVVGGELVGLVPNVHAWAATFGLSRVVARSIERNTQAQTNKEAMEAEANANALADFLASFPGETPVFTPPRSWATWDTSEVYTVPAGTLAGIVEIGSTAHYVWFRVRDDRVAEYRGGVTGQLSSGLWGMTPRRLYVTQTDHGATTGPEQPGGPYTVDEFEVFST